MDPEELEELHTQVEAFRTSVDNILDENKHARQIRDLAIGISVGLIVSGIYLTVKYTIPAISTP